MVQIERLNGARTGNYDPDREFAGYDELDLMVTDMADATPRHGQHRKYTDFRIRTALDFHGSTRDHQHKRRQVHAAWLATLAMDEKQRLEHAQEIAKLAGRYPDYEWDSSSEITAQTHLISVRSIGKGQLDRDVYDTKAPVMGRLFSGDGFFLEQLTQRLTGRSAAHIAYFGTDGEMHALSEFPQNAVQYVDLMRSYRGEWDKSSSLSLSQNTSFPLISALAADNEVLMQLTVHPVQEIYRDALGRAQKGEKGKITVALDSGQIQFDIVGKELKHNQVLATLKEVMDQEPVLSKVAMGSVSNGNRAAIRPNHSERNW
ncbi:hypothetical protein C4579_03200 [Candidatus Microgenomates bacterium]|nr:MAG: hypothetical protein C4579_03200 [Candidatus Microgenomates bacterium]